MSGSAGAGTTMHIAAEQFNVSAGTKITHVPYRGIAPALNDIMGGHIDFLNGDITVLYPLVKQGPSRSRLPHSALRCCPRAAAAELG